MLLIDDLLFAPFSGWNFIMRTLLKVAEEQWTDDAPLKEKLLHLQVDLEDGSITEDQYLEAEALILREIREVVGACCSQCVASHYRDTHRRLLQ